MRQIHKNTPPNEYLEWLSESGTKTRFYGGLTAEAKEALYTAFLTEQGYICAYTGHRISRNNCHIEHLLPQDHCVPGSGEDVAYDNMVACFPKGDGNCPYGAIEKKNWPTLDEKSLFVSPLEPRCDTVFKFNERGQIKPAEDDSSAKKTIEKLKLDHDTLNAFRREAIETELRRLGKAPTIAQMKDRIGELATMREGKLTPFCFAIQQVLEHRLEKTKYIRESKVNATKR